MSGVTVNIKQSLFTHEAGAVRINVPSGPLILVAPGLPLDVQTSLVDSLLGVGEWAVYVQIPSQRPPVSTIAV